jgi:hypothetical protein
MQAALYTRAANDNAVVITGFYTFTRMVDGKPVPVTPTYLRLSRRKNSARQLRSALVSASARIFS